MNNFLYTDFYQLTMAQGYFLDGKHTQHAAFDYFFRHTPFKGGHVVFAGLADLLDAITNLTFSTQAIDYLATQGFDEAFLDYLTAFTFSGDIMACREGEIIFPLEPALTVEGNVVEAQLIESLVLNTLNFQSLIATKASRIALACEGLPFFEFGMRRGPSTGTIAASRAACIGGASGTSNTLAAQKYDLPLTGTMSHAWVQNFENELTAFNTFATHYPDRCILLVDTYNTLESGVPNAIEVAARLKAQGKNLLGIRLDSGDLAYLSKKARAMLDDAGFPDTQIVVTNQLDEYLIKSLLDQNAPIDAFGVGTRLVTGHNEGALDGVYKLCMSHNKPCLKISDNFTKVNFPGSKSLYRFTDPETNMFHGDAFCLSDETQPTTIYHPFFPEQKSRVTSLEAQPLLSPVIQQGKFVGNTYTTEEISTYAAERLAQLPPEHKRFANPHTYKVGVSKALLDLRSELYNALQIDS